jgi:hypothetical protein
MVKNPGGGLKPSESDEAFRVFRRHYDLARESMPQDLALHAAHTAAQNALAASSRRAIPKGGGETVR